MVAGYVREHFTRVQVLAPRMTCESGWRKRQPFQQPSLPFGSCSYNPLWDEELREREWVALLVDTSSRKMLTN